VTVPDEADDVDAPGVPDDWASELRAKRAEKDAFLAAHPQSPVPPAARDAFDGLDYYPPDPAYRVAATARVHDDPDPVELETSAGPPVRYLRVATLETPLPGAPDAELAAIRREGDDDGALFVPFADATAGEATYLYGRYLELLPERDPADGDAVIVDFNLAYTPFCAFSETFACPYPPAANVLSTAVEAGERVRAGDVAPGAGDGTDA
jgi:uncharacterized protein (DUF1684 family)